MDAALKARLLKLCDLIDEFDGQDRTNPIEVLLGASASDLKVAADNLRVELEVVQSIEAAKNRLAAVGPAESVVLQARAPEDNDPWKEVSVGDFTLAQTNGYEVRRLYPVPLNFAWPADFEKRREAAWCMTSKLATMGMPAPRSPKFDEWFGLGYVVGQGAAPHSEA